MSTDRSRRYSHQRLTCACFGIILLVLSACGVPDQQGKQAILGNATPTQTSSAPSMSAAASLQPPSATFSAQVAETATQATPLPIVEVATMTQTEKQVAAAPAQPTSTNPVSKPQPSPVPPEPLNPTEPAGITPTPPMPTTANTSAAWQSYGNARAGYTVEYPAGWTVNERAGAGGGWITTFAPSNGGAGIEVMVQAGETGAADNDLPNTRCEAVMVAGIPATRCRDTISFTTTTTFSSRGNTYSIVAAGKQIDATAYQHLLDSFQLLP